MFFLHINLFIYINLACLGVCLFVSENWNRSLVYIDCNKRLYKTIYSHFKACSFFKEKGILYKPWENGEMPVFPHSYKVSIKKATI